MRCGEHDPLGVGIHCVSSRLECRRHRRCVDRSDASSRPVVAICRRQALLLTGNFIGNTVVGIVADRIVDQPHVGPGRLQLAGSSFVTSLDQVVIHQVPSRHLDRHVTQRSVRRCGRRSGLHQSHVTGHLAEKHSVATSSLDTRCIVVTGIQIQQVPCFANRPVVGRQCQTVPGNLRRRRGCRDAARCRKSHVARIGRNCADNEVTVVFGQNNLTDSRRDRVDPAGDATNCHKIRLEHRRSLANVPCRREIDLVGLDQTGTGNLLNRTARHRNCHGPGRRPDALVHQHVADRVDRHVARVTADEVDSDREIRFHRVSVIVGVSLLGHHLAVVGPF